jgi:hypothetical protein
MEAVPFLPSPLFRARFSSLMLALPACLLACLPAWFWAEQGYKDYAGLRIASSPHG